MSDNAPLVKAHKEFMAKEEKALQSGIGSLDGRPHEQNAVIQTEQPSLSDAALALVDKLDAIHADPEYQSVWVMSANRGAPYKGPQYRTELDRLKALLSAQRQDSNKDAALYLTPSELDLVLAEFRASVSNGGKDPDYIIVRDKAEKLRAAIANGAPK